MLAGVARHKILPRVVGRAICSSSVHAAPLHHGDYTSYLSARSLARQESPIRALQPLLAIEGMISLGGGMPNVETFPFTSLKATLTDGSDFTLEGETLNGALQYSPTPGLPSLLKHIVALQANEHGGVQPETAKVCVTTGSQDALSKAFDMLLDSDQALLLDDPTYSGSLAYLQPIGCELVGVPSDVDGLRPNALRSLLEAWEPAAHEGRQRPRVLYTVPTGGNPTGCSLSLERKQEIYRTACEFGMIILEDDPYYWLQFGTDADSVRTPSFMSMDVEGRVLRFDSFSKLLSSGMRLGFATGPPQLIERLELHTQASTLHTAGVTQALAAGLFERWEEVHGSSYTGFVLHCGATTAFYKARRDSFLTSAQRHLSGLASWSVPAGGMFVWINLHGIRDSAVLLERGARDAKVLLVPGTAFCPVPNTPSSWVRAAYSTASLEDMDTALQRLASLLKSS